MNREPDESAELRGLLEALAEERITPDQAERLGTIILSDPKFEEMYITYMTMQADLVREFGGHSPVAAGGWPGGIDGPEAERPGVIRSKWAFWPGPRWVPWGIAAAACLVSVLTLSLSTWGRRDVPTNLVRAPGPGTNLPDAGGERLVVQDKLPLAVVIKLVDARWEMAGDAAPVIGRVLPSGRLRLRSGMATLAYVNGVMLTLEGPADVDLISVDRVFCRRGKLRSRVPKGAEGFVIASPSSAVVDLGTELALNVDADGQARIMVFEGAAEAALLSESGTPRRSQIVEKSQAFDLNPRTGRIEESEARPERFVASPDLNESDLNIAPSYSSEIIQSRPRGYWRFETLIDGMAPNEVEGSPRLRVNGPIRLSRSPAGNGYAVFEDASPEQYLDCDGLWELPADPGHAVELWFQADAYSRGSLVGFYPPRSMNPPDQLHLFLHSFLVEVMSWERLMLHKPASVRFLHRWPIDIHVTDSLFSENVYIPRRWHHVVAQKRDGRLDLFLDGVLERSTPLEPDHPTLRCHLIVGRRTPEGQNPKDSRSFVGRIDELAIYDHPLSDEEVRRHFRFGSESLGPD
jgi:hypothetical protein